MLVLRAKWAFGSALCTVPDLFFADLSGLGPFAGVLAWCAMVPLVRWYLQWNAERKRAATHARRR
ncbi:hypothetical protein ACGFYE_18300 [Streptomyces zaomyceticus]|uniref:hypothetical protein n=1 Tax=Streptomyces zaomyceticus TaxID=68286 RepID=UPI003713B410